MRTIAYHYLKNKRTFQGSKIDGKAWKYDYLTQDDAKFRAQSAATDHKMKQGVGKPTVNNSNKFADRTPHTQKIDKFSCHAIRLNTKGKFYDRIISANQIGLYKMDPKSMKVVGAVRKGNNKNDKLPEGCYGHDSIRKIHITSNLNCPLIVLEYFDGPLVLILKNASVVELVSFLMKMYEKKAGRPFALPNVVIHEDGIATNFGKNKIKIESQPRNAAVGEVKFEKVRTGYVAQYEMLD